MSGRSRVVVTGPLSSFASGFRADLGRRGYRPGPAGMQLQLMADTSRWLADRGLGADDLTALRVERLMVERRAAGCAHLVSPRAMRPVLDYLRGVGVVPAGIVAAPLTPSEALIERYAVYLVERRGVSSSTVRNYVGVARVFLSWRETIVGTLALEGLSAAAVSEFVLLESGRCSVGSAKCMVTRLRSLLRFLHVEGEIDLALAGAVPSVASWRLASLVKALDQRSIVRLLGSCDRRTRVGRRDFAIMTLLSRLGLRAGEVAALQLANIDWRHGELLVRGKGSREERLPLPADVGEALAGWLRRGRPRCECVYVFTRVRAPYGGLSPGGVSAVVRQACRRTGLPVVGAHRLRHTAATEMLRAGGSLQEVGQVLRHRRAGCHLDLREGRQARAGCGDRAVAGGRGMNDLHRHVEEYLTIRRALGFKLVGEGHLLAEFVAFADAAGQRTVTTEAALQWARLPASGSPAYLSRRLRAVRAFARFLQASDPACEVPPLELLPASKYRPTPYLYSDKEILALMAAARELRPPLRAATFETLIGLLACTGLRIGEAIGLDRDDFDADNQLLTVRDSKFGKSREALLHDSTVRVLADYAERRDRLCPDGDPRSFFLTTRGTRPTHPTIYKPFRALLKQTGVKHPSSPRRARIHDLRHSFAIKTLLGWYRDGHDVAVRAAAVHLSRARRPSCDLLVSVRRAGAARARRPTPGARQRATLMTALAPTLQAFFTDRLINAERRQPAHHRRIPRHVPAAALLRSRTTRQAAVRARPRRPRRAADRRVPRPPRTRPRQQRPHPQRPAGRDPLAVPATPRCATPNTPPADRARARHPAQTLRPRDRLLPHPRRSRRAARRARPHPLDRPPRPRPADPRDPDRPAGLRTDRPQLLPGRPPRHRRARPLPRAKDEDNRCTPLTTQTVAVLRHWLHERDGQPDEPLFPTRRGRALSRDAVALLVSKHATAASRSCPTLHNKTISPHVLRHTAAMHLLHAGVDSTVIAFWLGHERPSRRPRSTSTPT